MNGALRFATSFLLCFLVHLSIECTNNGYPFENYLGKMTPYRIVSNKSFDRINYPGCTPKKVWMVIRHGTRNPKYSLIEQMNNRLPEIKKIVLDSSALPNEFIKYRDMDLLRKWKISLDPDEKNKLTHEGEEEMLILAERMQSRFPNLFDEVYSNTSYKFKYTYSQRTQKSAYYFAAGLFGKATAKDVWFPEPLKKDPILRFYKLCDKWKYDIKNNPGALREITLFENGAEIDKLVKDVNQRLQLDDNPLNAEDIVLIYKMCAYETAWNKKSKSPWCAFFSLDNLKVLEYGQDLKSYWQDGYGHELNYKQACPAIKDMINFLQTKNRFPRVNIYFTHSGTILKLLAHLGLYKDEETLTAKNYDTSSNRKWKTSLIDTFGSNLAFVTFECGPETKLLTMHQENIVRLPACPDSDLCELNTVRDYYFPSINSCDFSSMCRRTHSSK
ncbi:multiple inositol polyphosphate phosphatase 1 isoform X1 [Diorhabda carinulata]|uniref:multiple inositol polyphosphate phosphatase 1 isoform X1 n=3 Tax=Diorhabda carinulata TaxID=1163345 RepID=UPI0025A247E9|nr:multiple inositol polyphosphate phosphatase 1 isoform X1 [Diorhabda carinulata]XP_057666690.1 multiple inositol polyphosphate phosphatase 1 isoform X1 [Diorhabda carinulata]XP_057666692.1 multiple inositol polyphosphate phosphatase 1 isoform X1 [Diorhabda carinulata]